MTVTIKRAKEWLATLPIEEQRFVNRQYREYSDGISVIFRMGKDEWLLNHYYDDIENWNMNISKQKSSEEVGKEDTTDSQQEATDQEAEETFDEAETRDEDIESPLTEAQKKNRWMKIALAVFTAGTILLVL